MGNLLKKDKTPPPAPTATHSYSSYSTPAYTHQPQPRASSSYSSGFSDIRPTTAHSATTTTRATATSAAVPSIYSYGATTRQTTTTTAAAPKQSATTVRPPPPRTTPTTAAAPTTVNHYDSYQSWQQPQPAAARNTVNSGTPRGGQGRGRGGRGRGRGGGGRGRGRGYGGGGGNRRVTEDWYYHYTSTHSSKLIERSGKIMMAKQHDHYGPGVYFTKWSVEGGKTKREIAKNNFRAGGDAAYHKGRCDWAVKVLIPSNKIRRCPNKRDIWRYPDQDLMLCDFTYEIIKVDDIESDDDDDDINPAYYFDYYD